MLPAGLMWSVVTESPKIPSARAPSTLPGRTDCMLKSVKNGGSAI